MQIFIRADAGASVGTGHLMRCLALGQAWKDRGGDVLFATACSNPSLLERLTAENFEVSGPELPEKPPRPGSWLVLDGYQFGSDEQQKNRRAGWRVLAIDDIAHLQHYCADAVLNQNAGAEHLRYDCEPYTRLFLGPKYALLRREFKAWRGWRREHPSLARKLLVNFGGSDPCRLAIRTIQAIASIQMGLEVVVIAGAESTGRCELKQKCNELGARLETNVTDMARWMEWADIAISAAGSTCWELAFLGLPAILIVVADNQRAVGAELAARECALNLGWHEGAGTQEIGAAIRELAVNQRLRQNLSESASRLVDGRGCERVVEILLEPVKLLQTQSPQVLEGTE